MKDPLAATKRAVISFPAGCCTVWPLLGQLMDTLRWRMGKGL